MITFNISHFHRLR